MQRLTVNNEARNQYKLLKRVPYDLNSIRMFEIRPQVITAGFYHALKGAVSPSLSVPLNSENTYLY